MANKTNLSRFKIFSDIENNPVVYFFSKHTGHFVLAGFMVLCFYPVLSCWYYGDDVVSMNIHAIMKYENKNLYEFMANQMEYYIVKLGRFFPGTHNTALYDVLFFKHNNKIQNLYSCYEHSDCFMLRAYDKGLFRIRQAFLRGSCSFPRSFFLTVPI